MKSLAALPDAVSTNAVIDVLPKCLNEFTAPEELDQNFCVFLNLPSCFIKKVQNKFPFFLVVVTKIRQCPFGFQSVIEGLDIFQF